MPTAGSGAKRSVEIEARQRQHHRRGIEQRHREPLAGRELERRDGRRQQRLERHALALAGRRVERRRHAAHHRGKEPVERDEEEHERARALRRGEIARLEIERIRDLRRDAAQQQAAASPFAIERAQQAFDLGDGGARAVARAVVGETNRPRPALRDVLGERGVDLEHDVEVAASYLRLEVRRCRRQRDLLALEERLQRRRPLDADHRQRQLAHLVGLPRDQVQHEQHQHRAGDDRRHERHQHRPAIADDVDDLLPRDDRDARRRGFGAGGGRHAARPSPEPSSRTKASSSTAAPGLRDELGGGPGRDDPAAAQDHDRIAERRDFLHHVRAEEQALAAAPQFAQQVAQRADAHDVETVGGLVEQDRLRVVDERARDRHLHPLALREALRAAIGDGRDAERANELVDPRLERDRRRGRAARRSSGCSRGR